MPRSMGWVAALAALAACGSAAEPTSRVASLEVEPVAAALCVGDSILLRARALDRLGTEIRDLRVRWRSSAPHAVAVDSATGLARALATGAAIITARVEDREARSSLEVPDDLVPELVPDTVVLAPGDTISLRSRVSRGSGGPLPGRAPRIALLDSASASLDPSGVLTAREPGRSGLEVELCGTRTRGAVEVFVPADSIAGLGYWWTADGVVRRVRLPTRAVNFSRRDGGPAFQIFGRLEDSRGAATHALVYEDTVALAGTGFFRVDSLGSGEFTEAILCTPPRPFAFYFDTRPALLLSTAEGTVSVTSFTRLVGRTAVSGRMVLTLRNALASGSEPVRGIFTFSAPLVRVADACPALPLASPPD